MSVAQLPSPPRPSKSISGERRVVNCYSFFDKVFPAVGFLDYTEGMYYGDPSTPHESAQLNQIRYVLDEVHCTAGTRILDVGCGNGALLDEVRRRGAAGVGITISPEQVDLCRSRGLDARLIDYKNLGDEWTHQFDCVVANGSIEHFVQPRDAARGLTDEVYRRMFRIFHQAIDPSSSNRRLINTTIHFIRPPRPEDLLERPRRFPRHSDNWHWAWLALAFGGWYPAMGQFERCAAGLFDLVNTIDGTQDYYFTSEEWLRRIRATKPMTRVGFKICLASLPFALRHPRQTFDMLTCMLRSESWNWQFRGNDPPTRLLRQTWEYRA